MTFFHERLSYIRQQKTNLFWILPFSLYIIWMLYSVLSFAFQGYYAWNIYLAVALLFRIILLATALYGGNVFFFNENISKQKKYRLFKLFVGYMMVLSYVFANLPRLSWEESGIISSQGSFLLWLDSFLMFFWPFSLYISLWWKKTQRYWGFLRQKDKKKQEAEDKKKGKQKVKRKVSVIILQNLDDIIQAIITVIIIQHFFFQLYMIPTESMVPTFLTSDRPVVTKLHMGPQIPLTQWQLPSFHEAKRGDIVVYEELNYEPQPLFQRLTHSLVFYLTLSMVNTDKDEFGREKVRFVVKRCIGEPGDKLMMVDDVLYIKRAEDDGFRILEDDKQWRRTDLYLEEPSIVERIRDFPVNPDIRRTLSKWDALRNEASLDDLEKSIGHLLDDLEEKISRLDSRNIDSFASRILGTQYSNPSAEVLRIKERSQALGINPFQDVDFLLRDPLFFYGILVDEAFHTALSEFVLSSPQFSVSNLYDTNSRKVNLLYKKSTLQRFIMYADAAFHNISRSALEQNSGFVQLYRDSNELMIYIRYFYDARNFPEFPKGKDEYLGEDEYFLLGDNRYNSLDFRYSHGSMRLRALDASDPLSVQYLSRLSPHSIPGDRIFGQAVLTIWPFHRFGLLK